MQVSISEKYTLTIQEASAYFNIGVKKMRRLAEENTGRFAVYSGNRYLIIRARFEEHLQDFPMMNEPKRMNDEERAMRKAALNQKDYLTIQEAEEFFGLDRHKFHELIDSGPQDFVVTFRSRRLILREEFEKYLSQSGRREELTNGKVGRKQSAKRLEA